ncbi:methyltransferase domain-containing protein [Sporichthya sp.]|uniref:class I SAM-dependent methyltransferase n=1 Tax=Sporichthya sp. TaxID=65475 RepID=UPI00182A9FDC|nr:methyltransferase domain-containing protein [Sporichthya sp.]MBA3744134.1 methyltransferase domain-containing protein [Sporichthya sp.]
MDEAKVEQFMGGLIGHMTGAMACFGIWLGDELGLYRALVDGGPQTAEALSAATGTNTRLVEEWGRGQAAAGLLQRDASGVYAITEEAALALANEDAPVFLARGMAVLGSLFCDFDKIAAAYRGNGAMSWGEHDQHLFGGTEWFFRPGYRNFLATEWIPAMAGVADTLTAGGSIADVGCGHGASAVVLAQAYPKARVHGFDFHEPSIQTAAKRAAEAGVADRITVEVASAVGYPGSYDLICFFDCLHDMGDPVGIARYAREHLNAGGSVLLVEPFALDGDANITENPMAALLYHASAAICTPNSLSQEVGLGIGAQAGPGRLQSVFTDAGFSQFEVVASSPVNLVIQARV